MITQTRIEYTMCENVNIPNNYLWAQARNNMIQDPLFPVTKAVSSSSYGSTAKQALQANRG